MVYAEIRNTIWLSQTASSLCVKEKTEMPDHTTLLFKKHFKVTPTTKASENLKKSCKFLQDLKKLPMILNSMISAALL